MKLREIVHEHRSSLGLIWGITIVEKLLWVIEPYFFGKLLDEVIRHKDIINLATEKFYLWPFIAWSGIFFANTLLGMFRKISYQKLLSGMLKTSVTTSIRRAVQGNTPTDRLQFIAQTTNDYILFLKINIPEIIEHLVWTIGSIGGLFFFDKRIGVICLLVIVPSYLMDNFTSPKILLSEREYHDRLQLNYNVIASRDPEKIEAHYAELIAPQIQAAKLSALGFSFLRLILFGIFVVVLYISFDIDHFTTGEVYTIVSYLWTYITSVETVPETRETLNRLLDLDSRDLSPDSEIL